jgi:hypothetical protein
MNVYDVGTRVTFSAMSSMHFYGLTVKNNLNLLIRSQLQSFMALAVICMRYDSLRVSKLSLFDGAKHKL